MLSQSSTNLPDTYVNRMDIRFGFQLCFLLDLTLLKGAN